MNTYSKGNRVELKFRKLFEARGYLTWKPSRAKYNSNDAFGLFDCIMLRGGEVSFVQIKSNPSHFYSARKEIAKWQKDNKLMVDTLIALYEGDNTWRIEWYNWLDNAWEKYPLT